nr:hypothetical protein [Tanacetum cinerariifolium]
MDLNIDFSGSEQIQTPQYPDVHPPSQEINDEVFHVKEDLMKSIQTFLEEFNCIPFEEKATILLQAWFRFFAIKHDQPENSNELFQKLLEDLKELAEYKESLKNSSKEIVVSNSNQEKEESHKTLTFLLCMHDNVDDLIESALNSKLLSINSQRLDNREQEVKNVVDQPAERGNHSIESLQNFRVIQPEYSPSMGYENPNTTLETELDEIIKSGVEELVPILSENEVTSKDKRECDMPICENSPVFYDHSEIFFDSKNDDDISVYDDAFEDIEYVEASLSDLEIVSVEEENDVEDEEIDLEDISQIQDVDLHEKLLSITRLISNIESLNDNPTLDYVLNSSVSIPTFEESNNSLSDTFSPEFETFCDHTLINVIKNDIPDNSSRDPLLEEADLFLASDNSIPPGIENSADDSEGDIRFLEELLIDDSILSHESSDSNFEDNPSVQLPPPEPPDAETDAGNEILVVMNNELECLNPRDKLDDDDYFSFMIAKVFSLLSAESEDTIFDLGFTPHRLKFLVFGYLSRSKRSSHPFFENSLGKSISLISIA